MGNHPLLNRAVSPNRVIPDGNLTNPRSFGVYKIPTSATSRRRYRFGNHPVRMHELERDFGSCELLFLFLDRSDAMAVAALHNEGES